MMVEAMALMMITASPIRNSTSRTSLLMAADGVATACDADESGKLERPGKGTSAQKPPDCSATGTVEAPEKPAGVRVSRANASRPCPSLDGVCEDHADTRMSWTAEESLRFRRRVGSAAVPADSTRVESATGTVAQHPDVPRGLVDAPDLIPRLVLEAAEDQEQDLAHHPPRRSDLTRRPGDRRGGLLASDRRHADTHSA